jgi:hypothetical protein
VLVEDWYKEHIAQDIQRQAGPVQRMSDSEVLRVALAGQWRVGVAWRSERGVVRYMQAHVRHLFPGMLARSQFNARVRWLWGAFIRLQQGMAEQLSQATDVYEALDCVPLPAYRNGQALKEAGHWLWESTLGHGGTTGGFYHGDKLLMSVTPQGVISGWVVGKANLQDRWLLEAFVSARAGCPALRGPAPSSHAAHAQRVSPALGHFGAWPAVGQALPRPYLTDQGFNSQPWRDHWLRSFGVDVISLPPSTDSRRARWSPADCRWLASARQPIETAFAALCDVFGLKRLDAHARWGQYTRLAAISAAYNIGLFLNRRLARPLFALATLIVCR